MLLNMVQYINTLRTEQIANRTVQEVYDEYCDFARKTDGLVWSKIYFSREINRAFGMRVERHRVDGKLTGFYVAKGA